MKIVILVGGKKRVGKDTVAKEIVKQLEGYSVNRLSFAEPMKEIIADTFNVSLVTIETIKNEPSNFPLQCKQLNVEGNYNRINTDMRQVLQRFGTEAMKKQFGNDVWAELLYKKIHSDITVVSDWRFKSELEYLKKQKGVKVVTVYVNRLGLAHKDTHISEKDLDDVKCDYLLQNVTDNIELLNCQIETLLTDVIVPCEYPDYPFSYFGGSH